MNEKKGRGLSGVTLLIFVVFLFAALWFTNQFDQKEKELTWKEFQRVIEKDNVESVVVSQNKNVPTGRVEVELKDKKSSDSEVRYYYVSDVNEIQSYLKEKGIDYEMPDVPQDSWLTTTIVPMLLMFGGILIIFFLMNRQGGGANAKAMSFGKSRARLSTDTDKKITFAQVAGLQEEKEELEEIVDFLKSPKKYIQVGARIPKGVLLVGPPGTGKTLLAKAVAGEAGVPFFTISGSDFVEMFVGVGASRVRDLFEEAKKNAPCIIFIDEIDAVARRRGTGMGGGHDEREQTLNQLLVEMDGFGVNEGIIVMAATNRVDILDPAILRPGRFDRKVMVGRPDVKGREEILKVHAKGKPLSEEVDLKQIAQTTAGFTGADLENLLNESAIIAAKDNRIYLKQEDIRKAFVKVGIGAEKKSRIISDKEKRITAFHEAGHAILFHVLPDVGPVYSVSIIPTGGAGGYTMPLPENDEMFNTRGKMLQDITVALGGRVAEEEVLDDITTGASQDIKQATSLAKSMVTKFGMSETVGLVNYDDDSDEVFIGRDLAHASRGYGESVATIIDQEVKRIIDECYTRARSIIKKYDDVLHSCAELLLEKEKISRDEFESLFTGEVSEA
ncbi:MULTISPECIES: ATP-dependent zinc metalloprotease FtsH [Extibacter]|uniref:ATP-dependent zinc metalloprotease FtsH n=1 Tax=Extibacter TaxID=1918452 RepID=UPI001AA0E3B8|nr:MULTISPECIES: ATP-dependent zinc metalloprotease FtsH [Extibacter]BDF32060.1 ATP-dependent zinc metalloprotease FtsH [Lachnospiraceae bacterium]MBO1720882.1 ATP-dependent zinc metalloprotease FtsH [Extibacter sp. GGCC_0201]MCB6203751.1 ATP-dependent zinc metalloprotease FtsH [Extibacter muris]MCQ4665493.1 ATP-dependent zinc metalloprotease FtsH [Extibacter muris]MCQ4694872.1 ATP-dependent zinc metalloprotease FtsH [Extibacter muris]